MPQSYYKIWLHVVFSTKHRLPLIEPAAERKIHDHMREQLIAQGCPVGVITGMPDHVHLLFLHNPRISIADVIKQVKGNTSHWINKNDLTQFKFAWQEGYGVFSVSDSQQARVYQYIKNQKEHHSKKLFADEYDEFIAAHGLIKENEIPSQINR